MSKNLAWKQAIFLQILQFLNYLWFKEQNSLGGSQIGQSGVNNCLVSCLWHYLIENWMSRALQKDGFQGFAGRTRFTWYGSEWSWIIFPWVLLMVWIFMALKKLTFELARASGWNYCIPFLAKGARNKICSFNSNIDILTIYGPIMTIPFSVGPYNYHKYLWFVCLTHLMLESGYWPFNKCSDLCGTPGMYLSQLPPILRCHSVPKLGQ